MVPGPLESRTESLLAGYLLEHVEIRPRPQCAYGSPGLCFDATDVRPVRKVQERLLDPGDKGGPKVRGQPFRIEARDVASYEPDLRASVSEVQYPTLLRDCHHRHGERARNCAMQTGSGKSHQYGVFGAVVGGGDSEGNRLQGRHPSSPAMRGWNRDVVASRKAVQ